MSTRIEFDNAKIADFCKRWSVVEFSFFGSVLRDDFRPESDVDVLVKFAPSASSVSLIWCGCRTNSARSSDARSDLVEREAVERSENYIRRKHILSNLESVYVAR